MILDIELHHDKTNNAVYAPSDDDPARSPLVSVQSDLRHRCTLAVRTAMAQTRSVGFAGCTDSLLSTNLKMDNSIEIWDNTSANTYSTNIREWPPLTKFITKFYFN